ncbi:MAG TPA: hypothetical protein VLG67_00570 [Candidatus Saccharimonadales bacterium]|nr:hypothetical protein [Candidatus Saccharimonadales bacterium]
MARQERSRRWRETVATIGVSLVAVGGAVGVTGVALSAKELQMPGPKPDQAINLAIKLEEAGTLIAGAGAAIASTTRGRDGKLPI